MRVARPIASACASDADQWSLSLSLDRVSDYGICNTHTHSPMAVAGPADVQSVAVTIGRTYLGERSDIFAHMVTPQVGRRKKPANLWHHKARSLRDDEDGAKKDKAAHTSFRDGVGGRGRRQIVGRDSAPSVEVTDTPAGLVKNRRSNACERRTPFASLTPRSLRPPARPARGGRGEGGIAPAAHDRLHHALPHFSFLLLLLTRRRRFLHFRLRRDDDSVASHSHDFHTA